MNLPLLFSLQSTGCCLSTLTKGKPVVKSSCTAIYFKLKVTYEAFLVTTSHFPLQILLSAILTTGQRISDWLQSVSCLDLFITGDCLIICCLLTCLFFFLHLTHVVMRRKWVIIIIEWHFFPVCLQEENSNCQVWWDSERCVLTGSAWWCHLIVSALLWSLSQTDSWLWLTTRTVSLKT